MVEIASKMSVSRGSVGEVAPMRIVIRPPNSSDGERAVLAGEIQKAMAVLRSAYIPTDGSGSFERDGEMWGVVILHYHEDGPTALRVLFRAGIRAVAE